MNKESNTDFSFLYLQYEALLNRRQTHHTFIWNVPVILFTAESILWGISFGKVPNEICCFISLISVLVAFASWQQFERGRLMEIADSEQLFAIELIMKSMTGQTARCPVMIVNHNLANRTIFISGKEHKLESYLTQQNQFLRKIPLARIRTFAIWRVMFVVIFLFSLFLFIYNLYMKWPF